MALLNKHIQFFEVRKFKESANFYGIGGFGVLAGISVILLTVYRNLILAMPCPFKTITGISCPTCGSTRFAFAVLDFEFLQALKFNPLLFIFAVFMVVQFLVSAYFTARKRYFMIKFSPTMININRVLIIAAVLGTWIYEWLIFPKI
ncbi:MAG: DUF2752 domain-containing protein [Calditrichia bacterium]|nr:DUF2752 domain-containing protein [Calditrichia bacterium]